MELRTLSCTLFRGLCHSLAAPLLPLMASARVSCHPPSGQTALGGQELGLAGEELAAAAQGRLQLWRH